MSALFLCYPKCTTCQKAKAFLSKNGLTVKERHIVEENPKKDELLSWMQLYEGEPKKFFNTSGQVYREMQLKDKVAGMTKEEMAEVLSTNGMLVKRPLLILEHGILIGFKEEQWRATLLDEKTNKNSD